MNNDHLTELKAKAKKAKKSLGLGGWFVFPEDAFAFQITTASGPHRGLHVAQDMRKEDAEFVAALANAFPALCKRLEQAEAVVAAAEKAFERRRKVTPEHWWIQEEDLWAAEKAIENYRAGVESPSQSAGTTSDSTQIPASPGGSI